MFFARRRHRCSLLHLVLLILGFKAVRRHCCQGNDSAKQEELKAKASLFRSKLKEAFGVWKTEEKQETPAAE